jgi:hypothetical protein
MKTTDSSTLIKTTITQAPKTSTEASIKRGKFWVVDYDYD